MKRMILAAAAVACLFAFSAVAQAKDGDPEGALSYCLPNTSLSFEVEAIKEVFHVGPYAKYAQKYLGVDARQEDGTTYILSKITMTPYIEADQSARYYLQTGSKAVDAAFLHLTSCGLVSVSDGSFGVSSIWRFPVSLDQANQDNGLISNTSSESTTLYRNVKSESDYTTVAVTQQVTVAKTVEQKAAETASLIFDLRKKRIQILTGDTDATYSGEAMGAAVEELAKLEKEYMSMFVGYTDSSVQTVRYDVVPEKDRTMYIAFRFSETAGLMNADELSGTPIVLEITPNEVYNGGTGKVTSTNPSKYCVYRVPAVCTVKLRNGSEVIMTTRLPIHQYGYDSSYTLSARAR
ncbi:MAG: DUF4831 family protein [Bacteroidales bacterium]|nr:DUF4831 family protein [Bacteroidales bacterium]